MYVIYMYIAWKSEDYMLNIQPKSEGVLISTKAHSGKVDIRMPLDESAPFQYLIHAIALLVYSFDKELYKLDEMSLQ